MILTGGVHVPVGIGRAKPELNPPTDSFAVYCNVNMVLRLRFPVSAFHKSSPVRLHSTLSIVRFRPADSFE